MDQRVYGGADRPRRRASRPLSEIPSNSLNSQHSPPHERPKAPTKHVAHSASRQDSQPAVRRSSRQQHETFNQFPGSPFATERVQRDIWPRQDQSSSSSSIRHSPVPASTRLSALTAPRTPRKHDETSNHDSLQRAPASQRPRASQPPVLTPSSNATSSSTRPKSRTLAPPAAWPNTGLGPVSNGQAADLAWLTGPAMRTTAPVISSSAGPGSRRHPSLQSETVSHDLYGSATRVKPASSRTSSTPTFSPIPPSHPRPSLHSGIIGNARHTSSAFPAEYSHLRQEAKSLLQLADPTMPPLIPSVLGDLDSSPEPPGDASEEIQKLFQNLPDIEIAPEDRANTPPQMSCKLMEHQKVALKWLKDQEKNRDKRGGLLAGMSLLR